MTLTQHAPTSAAFMPHAPMLRCPPEKIAPETWLIRQVQPALGAPLCVYLNSMVITGAEPIIVDTGTAANRGQWFDDVFSVVEPASVRWVFISHDDVDHTGNLADVLATCPGATLVCSWAIVERLSNALEFPLARCRWVNDGESFDAGDRRLRALRPPVYDSPTTRGLLDESTGVYWASDAFATPMPGAPVSTVAELEPAFWRDGHAMFSHHALAPWLGIVDEARYQAGVDGVSRLGITCIAGAHTPTIPGSHLEPAMALMRDLPGTPPPPCPDQAVLDLLLTPAPAPSA